MPLLEERTLLHGHRLYEPEPAEIVSVRKLTALENHCALRFLHDEPLGHAPGQFVQIAPARRMPDIHLLLNPAGYV
jgi:hypothetical protein